MFKKQLVMKTKQYKLVGGRFEIVCIDNVMLDPSSGEQIINFLGVVFGYFFVSETFENILKLSNF